MGKYIVKRILQVIPMLFILSLIVFMMVRLIPGDPVDMMLGMDIPKDTKEYERERLGLNDPLYIQYFRFVGNALHGDLGTSIFSGKPVVEELAKRFPKTLTLAVGGTLFGAAVGVLLGIIAAIHRNKFADNLIMVLSLLTVSTPSFFLALILMLIFCLNLRWLPSIGMDTWQGAILPIATLGLQAIGSIARTTRSAMLDVIHQDYIRTSRSRGVPERVITYRHAFKNALIPVLTTIGLRFGGLLAGATLVELDVSIQSQIINLLKELQRKRGLTYLFVAHDMSVIRYISDRVGVMYLGHLVEEGDTDEVFDHPQHPYTRTLMSAVPSIDPRDNRQRILLEGDLPSPIDPPSGCVFHTRCPWATEACKTASCELREVRAGHYAACSRGEQE